MILDGLDNVSDLTARNDNSTLLYLGLFTKARCNLKCIYCYEDCSDVKAYESVPFRYKNSIIRQAAKGGAKSLVIPGAGEPFLDKDLRRIVSNAADCGLKIVIYTNGTCLNKTVLSWLRDTSVSLVVKLESLDSRIHDHLTEVKGSFSMVSRNLGKLLDAGFNPK